MTPSEIQAWLANSLEDRHLSRNERQGLRDEVTADESVATSSTFRELAFQLAREALTQETDRPILDWLDDVLSTVDSRSPPSSASSTPLAEAYFSPGDDCPRAIDRLLRKTKKTADICVFTITDDRLSEALLNLHRRGVDLRIITDDAKAEDIGSDINRLESAGIPVRVDRSPFHMHHKFALLDGQTLLTGSYNWTRSAARDNEENIIVSTDPRLIGPFQATFERLWKKLA